MNQEETGSAEWFNKEWKRWFRRITIAIIQSVSFVIMVGLHMGMEYGLELVIPPTWQNFHGLLRGAIGLVFSAIYLGIAIDTLVIFVPGLNLLKEFLDGTRFSNVEVVQTRTDTQPSEATD